MGFSDKSCSEFVEVLATKAPVPGGGGASAMVGALATALGNMVGSLTVGKKKYAAVEEEMWALKDRCDRLQKDFLHLVERDAEVRRRKPGSWKSCCVTHAVFPWRSWRNAAKP